MQEFCIDPTKLGPSNSLVEGLTRISNPTGVSKLYRGFLNSLTHIAADLKLGNPASFLSIPGFAIVWNIPKPASGPIIIAHLDCTNSTRSPFIYHICHKPSDFYTSTRNQALDVVCAETRDRLNREVYIWYQ